VRIRREPGYLVSGQMHEARGSRLHPIAAFWTFGNRQTMDLAVRSPIMRFWYDVTNTPPSPLPMGLVMAGRHWAFACAADQAPDRASIAVEWLGEVHRAELRLGKEIDVRATPRPEGTLALPSGATCEIRSPANDHATFTSPPTGREIASTRLQTSALERLHDAFGKPWSFERLFWPRQDLLRHLESPNQQPIADRIAIAGVALLCLRMLWLESPDVITAD